MKITQFKKMLSVHGANLTRWEGGDPADAETFIDSSEQAQALYKEAQALDRALDSFRAEAPDPAILDQVMERLGITPAEKETATVHKFESRARKPFITRPVFWGGVSAIAAAVLLFVSSLSGPAVPPGAPGVAVIAQENTVPVTVPVHPVPDVDIVLAELDQLAEEELARQEITGWWRMADASAAHPQRGEIDAFLDELFSEPPQEPEAQGEMDLWELFIAGHETVEL